MILAVTGHRPDKLGGYSSTVKKRLEVFARRFLAEIRPAKVLTGMALGWDQAIAEAALLENIPFVAAIPFRGQHCMWPAHAQQEYRELVERACEVVITSVGYYAPWKMHVRNKWLVNNSECVLALWNGASGGTAACISYAVKQQKPVRNIWNEWAPVLDTK